MASVVSQRDGIRRPTIADMSERGWREFLAAEGVDDWVGLHGGPTAVLRDGSLQEAARLGGGLADVPDLGPRTLLTAASDRLTLKLTREMWGTEARQIEVARAIPALAPHRGPPRERP